MHLENKPKGSIAKQYLQISKDLADKNKERIMLKIASVRNQILAENSSPSLTSQRNNSTSLKLIKHNKELIGFTQCSKVIVTKLIFLTQ